MPRDRRAFGGEREPFGKLADVVILALYAVLVAGLAVLSSEPPYVTPLWAMLVLAFGGVGAIVTRHRYPRTAFAAVMVLFIATFTVGSGAESLLVLLALYTAGVRRPASMAWLCFAIAVACGSVAAVTLPLRGHLGPPILGVQPSIAPRDSLVDWANAFSVIAAILLIVTLLGTNVGHRRRYIGELVLRAEQLARERDQQAETARAHERERIAREMHDVIAHSLAVMIAISDGAHEAIDERPKEAKVAIGRVAETGRKTLGEVRRLLGTVWGDGEAPATEHAPQPDASRLAALVQEFTAAGLPVRFTTTGRPSTDPGLGLTVYRIVQESLTNVLRHARDVRSAEVTVAWLNGEVTVVVQDASTRASATPSAGRGLLGMRERVALYDGELEAGPEENGWRVFARLRWETETSE